MTKATAIKIIELDVLIERQQKIYRHTLDKETFITLRSLKIAKNKIANGKEN
jgi:hypothetical protein